MIIKWLIAIFLFCFNGYRHFDKTSCFTRAGSLSFSTVLALVPLMVVSVAILSVLPIAQSWQMSLQNFIFDNFVASSGKVIQHYLQEFVTNVNQLSWLSIIFLIVTAVNILFSIEQSLNAIWHTHQHRYWLKAAALYILILIVTPILFFLSITLTFFFIHSSSYIFSDFFPIILMKVLPVLFSLLIFLCLFKGMPHCYVKWRCAFGGAVIAAVLFEIAKTTFAWYVKAFPTYHIIYGAIAALPIFFIWVYICWMIVLIGAVSSYLLQQGKFFV